VGGPLIGEGTGIFPASPDLKRIGIGVGSVKGRNQAIRPADKAGQYCPHKNKFSHQPWINRLLCHPWHLPFLGIAVTSLWKESKEEFIVIIILRANPLSQELLSLI
jgi:hypothetical protein